MSAVEFFESMAAEYDGWFDDYPLILESEIEAVRRVTPPFKRAVEVGVGTGRFAAALGIGLGVEPAAAMAAMACARGITVVAGRAEALPLHDTSFDTLFMITVDCYLPELAPALRECWRVLEPGGALVVGHVDIDAPLGVVYEEARKSDPFYANAYLRGCKEIIAALEAAGFTVEEVCQTVYSFENRRHEIRAGHGAGVFAALRARKG